MNCNTDIGSDEKRTTAQKVALFRSLFKGREDVYGTYDLKSGRARQVKAPVTDNVILDHLTGRQPYGVYLLTGNMTQATVADFDHDDANLPLQFLAAAKHYGVSVQIERSKAKGFHAWVWLQDVRAFKARLVMRFLLEQIGQPNTEMFPKQDSLPEMGVGTTTFYGNFINAPLFGRLVALGKTVFLDPDNALKPYPNQWDALEGAPRVPEKALDEIIEVNGLPECAESPGQERGDSINTTFRSFGLPPCAQRMLAEGVTEYQRVACFRLAVDLRKAGVPLDVALAGLYAWALKNRPTGGKGIITRQEIMAQATGAYGRGYQSRGCNHPAVRPYCDPECPLYRHGQPREASVGASSERDQK